MAFTRSSIDFSTEKTRSRLKEEISFVQIYFFSLRFQENDKDSRRAICSNPLWKAKSHCIGTQGAASRIASRDEMLFKKERTLSEIKIETNHFIPANVYNTRQSVCTE
jgi:hypothetical protein